MQDSLKMNRNQRKKHRKTAAELAEIYPARNSKNRKQAKRDPAKLAAFREELARQIKRDKRRKIILLSSLVVIGVFLFWLLFI